MPALRTSVPPPTLDHIVALSDDVGIIQHACEDIPNRSTGYCTDDVARGLIVAVEALRRSVDPQPATRLASNALAFLTDAQTADGWLHGFLGYDRRWQDDAGTPDAVGRAIWGLGFTVRHAARPSWCRVAGRILERTLPTLERLEHLRSYAYATLGLTHAFHAVDGSEGATIRRALELCVTPIARAAEGWSEPGWRWCEATMTYDNARLPEALLRAGMLLENERFISLGLMLFDFYAGVVVEDGIFVPIGNDGWYTRGGRRARFGQQPIEAAAFIDAALAAFEASGERRYRRHADVGFGWFFGRNTHQATLVSGGGCRDGIDHGGPNANMGAESTLAYVMSSLTLARRNSRPLTVAG